MIHGFGLLFHLFGCMYLDGNSLILVQYIYMYIKDKDLEEYNQVELINYIYVSM